MLPFIACLVGLYTLGLGDRSSNKCGCQSNIQLDACISKDNYSELQQLIDDEVINDSTVIMLCISGPPDALSLGQFPRIPAVTILVDDPRLENITLSPEQLSSHNCGTIYFGNAFYPSKQIQFVEREILSGNHAVFSEGIGPCRVNFKQVTFSKLEDAENFLSVNEDLPNVTLLEPYAQIRFSDTIVNVTTTPGGDEVTIDPLIGTHNLSFSTLNSPSLTVIGGGGRGCLLVEKDLSIEHVPVDGLALKIYSYWPLTIWTPLIGADDVVLDFYGSGRVTINVPSQQQIDLLGKFTTCGDLEIASSGTGKVRAFIQELTVMNSHTIDCHLSNATVESLVISENSDVNVMRIAQFDNVHIKRNGTLRFEKWNGANFSMSIGALQIDVSPDSLPSIQLDDTPYPPLPLMLRSIDSISVNWDRPSGEFVWAYFSFSGLYREWLNTLETLAATDVLGDNWKIRYDLHEDLFGGYEEPSNASFVIFRERYRLPGGLIAIFTVSAVVDVIVVVFAILYREVVLNILTN